MTTWELQQQIHNAVRLNLKSGMTEKELGNIISEVYPKWRGDLISGERTADIEGPPTDRVIKKGDIVLLDLQVNSDNMWSDLTRVYFVGDITDKQRKAYDDIIRALNVGESLLRPGIKCKDLWKCMNQSINSEFAFTHHGGHLIDSEHFYLQPSFVPENEDVLQQGMMVTLEPGVYYAGEFGIRLENNYLITDNGYKRLCGLSLEISDYIVKG
ncbi:MAG: aminopeptidase P family protein [Clostridia bacterium]|nr:aminopeptidase P family protein [Clostridia bacterium]